jgi:two-component system, NarL family, response regulator DevR
VASLAGLTFLVVEGDAVLRRALAVGFAAHGTVEAVGTRAAARLALMARNFDAMIVEARLPDGSGLDLLDVARAECPRTYVLVLAGRTERAVIERSLEAGAGFLRKPLHPKHFGTVTAAARSRRDAGERRTRLTLERWAADHDLSTTEVELLALGAQGISRDHFSARRNVRPDTIRKQIQSMLQKTGNVTFENAVNRLLREALTEPT